MTLPDSGVRRMFGGAVRDGISGKPRYNLIPMSIINRLAVHYALGAEKYEERNWQKGMPISVYVDSFFRHFYAWLNDENDDEDHGAAMLWNVIGMLWTLQAVKTGVLPEHILYDNKRILIDDRKDML